MEHHIYAKESRGSATPRTLRFETPLRVGGPFDRRDVEGWVQITLLNKLRHPMGAMEIETNNLIDELTEVIAMLQGEDGIVTDVEIDPDNGAEKEYI